MIRSLLTLVLLTLVSTAASETDNKKPYILILGIAQDAGYPQTGCYLPHCMRAWKQPSLQRSATSLAVIDPDSKEKYLFEATPDIRDQLYRLHQQVPDNEYKLNGVFLTHGHMGHYTGLMHFGREAAGTKGLNVYAMPRMKEFLSTNGPWSQLVQLKNIVLIPIEENRKVKLGKQLSVVPVLVPHRDEYTETVGFKITGPDRTALFIPDIDKWQKWRLDIHALINKVDYALLDGTFFSNSELPHRDMSEIPHPFVEESMDLFSSLPGRDKSKIIFIHFNHSNPLLMEDSDAQREVTRRGYRFAYEGMRLDL